jgi:hypothetical protein
MVEVNGLGDWDREIGDCVNVRGVDETGVGVFGGVDEEIRESEGTR